MVAPFRSRQGKHERGAAAELERQGQQQGENQRCSAAGAGAACSYAHVCESACGLRTYLETAVHNCTIGSGVNFSTPQSGFSGTALRLLPFRGEAVCVQKLAPRGETGGHPLQRRQKTENRGYALARVAPGNSHIGFRVCCFAQTTPATDAPRVDSRQQN